jgi:hypothetical protein
LERGKEKKRGRSPLLQDLSLTLKYTDDPLNMARQRWVKEGDEYSSSLRTPLNSEREENIKKQETRYKHQKQIVPFRNNLTSSQSNIYNAVTNNI